MLIRSLLTGFTIYVSVSGDGHTPEFPTLTFSLMSFPLILNLKVDKNVFYVFFFKKLNSTMLGVSLFTSCKNKIQCVCV